MRKIRLENFRSIVDSGWISLSPITIAVGRNSAGKSSFVRIFPLLKQTLEAKTADPILWYGNYVDFGDYQHTVSKNKQDEPIIFSFEFNLKQSSFETFETWRHSRLIYDTSRVYDTRRFYGGTSSLVVELSILEKQYSKVKITIDDQEIVIKIHDDQRAEVSINGNEDITKDLPIYADNDSVGILPFIFQKNISNERVQPSRSFLPIIREKFMDYFCDKKRSSPWYWYFDDELPVSVGSKDVMLEQFKQLNKKFQNRTTNHKIFQRFNDYAIALSIPSIIKRINEVMNSEMIQTSYVMPIRAMVDRYYRVQGISIDELDVDGSNLPMILKNMSSSQLRAFETWSKEKFGIVFSVTSTEGHASLIIKDDVDSKEETNVADTGYGYSQMLPIVMLLWMIHVKKSGSFIDNKLSRTVVIEQPELHLHPAYQARMMEVFANIVLESHRRGIDLHIIIETHSEAMINRLGKLIAYRKFNANDVNVLVFNKVDNITSISTISYDRDGILKGWPIDFFDPEDIK